MGKTGNWIRNLLTGKRDNKEREDPRREKESRIGIDHRQNPANNGGEQQRPATPVQPTTPKEKKRWSFRRSSAGAAPGRQEVNCGDGVSGDHHGENDGRKQALAVAAAAADAAVAAAKAAAAVIQLTAVASVRASAGEEAAATKIQSVFRAYLARKALNALRGLVKLQALVRGHLVRKQATATLRCMQSLVNAQARVRAQRLRMAAEETKFMDQKQYNHRHSTQENRSRNSNQDFGPEENIKIVEMDLGDYKPVTKARNSYSNHTQSEPRISAHRSSMKQDHHPGHHLSPAPSALTDASPRTCSNHFEDYSFGGTAQSSPQCCSAASKPDPARIPFSSYPRSEYAESLYGDYPFYPNYMANTESSRAKVRSHSAPKQRPAVETPLERQPSSRRRPSIEGRNVPRAVRMQRSSSHVGSNAQNYQYPWSVKLDKSAVSLKDSECGSTSTVLTTNTYYCRSLVGFDVQGGRY